MTRLPTFLLVSFIVLTTVLPAQAQLVVDHTPGELRGKRVIGEPLMVTGKPVKPSPDAIPDSPAILKQRPGSYTTQASGPSLLTAGLRFVSQFSVPDHVPPNATITNVTWRYDLGETPGIRIHLCQPHSNICFNISQLHKGHTHFFNGRRASEPLAIIYEVRDGQPAQSQPVAQNQLIVTYSALLP